MKKRMICLTALCLLMVLAAMPVLAYGPAAAFTKHGVTANGVTPRYENILLVGGSINIRNGKAELLGQISAQPDKATSVEVIVTLQKLNSVNGWDDVQSWSVSKQGLHAGLVSSYYVLSNNCYRAQITGKAYIGSRVAETVVTETDPMWS